MALAEQAVSVLVDGLFVLTVVGLAVLVSRRLPIGARAVLFAWLLVIGVLGAAGMFLRAGRVPPYFAAVGLLPSAAAVAYVCSPAGTVLLARTSAAWLIGLQSFRVLVEIVLWALAREHRLSLLLTFEGRNLDILVGLTALPVAWLCEVRRAWPGWVAVVWNVAGIAILANVVIRALLSAPTPFQMIHTEPPTTIITTLPYIWLPGFLVPLALSLHVASLRSSSVAPTPAKERR